MRLFIPRLGDKLRLLEPWTFEISREKNSDLIDAMGDFGPIPDARTLSEEEYLAAWVEYRERRAAQTLATIPQDTILSVQRIYIRLGAKDYDSVTFRVMGCPNDPSLAAKGNGGTRQGGGLRFYAKLDDVNRLEIEVAN